MRRNIVARLVIGLVVLLIALYAGLELTAPSAAALPFFEGDGLMVIAHQGGARLRPGNTLASFSYAVELGADVLEMDIHSTADGVIVVSHDDTVDRTTNGSGRIQEMSLAELKELDAGYDWTDDEGQTFPFRGQGITVPTLEEVFTAFPDMRMNIEIKQQSPSIVEPFCQLLRDFDMIDRVLVASFKKVSIQEFRQKCPGVATSMVESEIRLLYVLNRLYLGGVFRTPAEAIQAPEFSGGIHVVTRQFVQAAQGHNINVHVWTVNETEDMRRLIDLGVDGIITDRPDRLLQMLGPSETTLQN